MADNTDTIVIIAAIGGLIFALKRLADRPEFRLIPIDATPPLAPQDPSSPPVPRVTPSSPETQSPFDVFRRILSGEPPPPAPPRPVENFVSLEALYRNHGTLKGLDWRLLRAIARVESSEQTAAKNPVDPSYGLMQILCQADCPGCQCKNKLNVKDWNLATPTRLITDPNFNVHIASQILRWNIQTYGINRGIAVYNSWGARNDPPNGPFRNQSYVDKVRREWGVPNTPGLG